MLISDDFFRCIARPHKARVAVLMTLGVCWAVSGCEAMAKPGLEPSAEINGGAASVIIFPAISEGVPYASPSELTLGCGHDGYLRYQSGRIAVPPVPLVEVHIDGQALDLPARWEIKESLRKSVVLQLRLTEEEQRAVVEALKGGQRLSVRAGGGSPEEVFDLRTNGSLCR